MSDLYEDLKDGAKIIKLLEMLSGEKLVSSIIHSTLLGVWRF